MLPAVVPVVIALAVAVAVLAVAARVSPTAEGWRPVRDLRAGLRRPGTGRVGLIAGARRDLVDAAEADSTGVDALLAGAQTGHGYVTADELAARLGLSTRR